MVSPNEFEKIYRPSATVIIASKGCEKEDEFDYKILLAKRTSAIAFAPNHHVFPGGVFDSKADDNPEWLKYFEEFDIHFEYLEKLCLEHLPNRPRPLMTNRGNLCRDISLRITAIRETFEEVGLLLCLGRDELKESHKESATFKSDFDRSTWQARVHNNSLEFLKLCRHLDVVPDIWSLSEWSVWRSPPASLKRYDTALYIVTLDQQPDLLLEPSEVEKALWVSPVSSLSLFKDRKIWLPPLQFYEISRLTNADSWHELSTFARQRQFKGSTLLMMAYYRCEDTFIGTLPYDDYYPANPLDHTKTIEVEGNFSDFAAKAKNLHRLIYRNMYDMSIVSNIPTIDYHLSPIARTMSDRNTSKL